MNWLDFLLAVSLGYIAAYGALYVSCATRADAYLAALLGTILYFVLRIFLKETKQD